MKITIELLDGYGKVVVQRDADIELGVPNAEAIAFPKPELPATLEGYRIIGEIGTVLGEGNLTRPLAIGAFALPRFDAGSFTLGLIYGNLLQNRLGSHT